MLETKALSSTSEHAALIASGTNSIKYALIISSATSPYLTTTTMALKDPNIYSRTIRGLYI